MYHNQSVDSMLVEKKGQMWWGGGGVRRETDRRTMRRKGRGRKDKKSASQCYNRGEIHGYI